MRQTARKGGNTHYACHHYLSGKEPDGRDMLQGLADRY